ncbi:hypothetical protein [Streptomyces sp. V3I7]|uniref:SCO6745 family protein n=1 Tax=Streptomyces sp. V3I7 TaxID=3042278 RepID=UPI00278B3C99|nr:hypothetical protein [Streptomyces sp. V3I7]MDQ0988957.1 hypothetical protein [Streptomyces sp. V3I7]
MTKREAGVNTVWSRMLWERYEPVHDLIYFTPEARQATDELGLRGYWMGYFAMRAAPLGAASPAVVTSSFYTFHPDQVARALPDAWDRAAPADVLLARERAMDAAMTRLFGKDTVTSPEVAEAADLAWEAAQAADTVGRVLGAANQALPRPDQPHVRLWQALTTLREHRGDGHFAVLVSHGLGPVAAMVLKAASGESDAAFLREIRQWDLSAWQAAEAELLDRGWLGEDGKLTPLGEDGRAAVEGQTDTAAELPWTALGPEASARLAHLLEPLARTVQESGMLPATNPVGLSGTKR